MVFLLRIDVFIYVHQPHLAFELSSTLFLVDKKQLYYNFTTSKQFPNSGTAMG